MRHLERVEADFSGDCVGAIERCLKDLVSNEYGERLWLANDIYEAVMEVIADYDKYEI